jgi:hypothetical protein
MKVRSRATSAILALVITASAAPSGGCAEPSTPRPERAVAGAAVGVGGIAIPDGPLARDAAQVIRAAEGDLLWQHSMRVYYWAALAGKRRGLSFDPELLYVAALFHDYGLTADYGESHRRFEVDGANAALDLLRRHGRSEAEAQEIWLAIALHTTNGISPHLDPIAALLAEGANMDLIGDGYDAFSDAERNAVEAGFPRQAGFAEGFLQALYDGLKHRPETTQGTGLADVMAYKDPGFRRRDFSGLMRRSPLLTAKPVGR